uniref:Uncharacterized protein n=1 Tax=Oryza punctata TaxID=4537 RepID=A0A0E0KN19_ORYPU
MSAFWRNFPMSDHQIAIAQRRYSIVPVLGSFRWQGLAVLMKAAANPNALRPMMMSNVLHNL